MNAQQRQVGVEVEAERQVAAWLAEATKVTVLTGAGISTDSGIPDFRGPNGLWTADPGAQRLFTLRDYLTDSQVRIAAWKIRQAHAAWTARPNPGHEAIVELENNGQLRAIITQNIDGMHQLAGNSEDLVIEVHGSLYEVECMSCGALTAMSDTLERVTAGEADPACLRCGGILKARTVSFGQPLEPAVLQAAQAAAQDCQVFLAIGTSLTVQPVASLVDRAAQHGAKIVIINAEPTPYDQKADARLSSPISEVLPRIISSGEATDARSAS